MTGFALRKAEQVCVEVILSVAFMLDLHWTIQNVTGLFEAVSPFTPPVQKKKLPKRNAHLSMEPGEQ